MKEKYRYVQCIAVARAADIFRRMWRKGSRVIVKVLCLWLFLGAYKFLKRGTSLDWRKPTLPHDAWDSEVSQVADDQSVPIKRSLGWNFVETETKHRRLSGPVQDNSRHAWISSSAHGKSSQIACLLLTKTRAEFWLWFCENRSEL